MTKKFSKSLWLLVGLGVLVVSSVAFAGSTPAGDLEAVPQAQAAAPEVSLDALLATSGQEAQAEERECQAEVAAEDDDRVFLWGPTNPNCPYRVCGGYNCNSNADCCGAFGGDGYCQQVPEGNNYCVCP